MYNVQNKGNLQLLLAEYEAIKYQYSQGEYNRKLMDRKKELEEAIALYKIPKYSTGIRIASGITALIGIGAMGKAGTEVPGFISLEVGVVVSMLGVYGVIAKKIDPQFL